MTEPIDKRAAILRVNDLPDWFLDRVQPEPMSGCWLWGGSLNSAGYGSFCLPSPRDGVFRPVRMHRYAYMTLRNPGLVKDLDHRCRVRACCNPDHLVECTDWENCFAPGSLNRAKAQAERTECLRGHPFSPENTYRDSSRQRHCRACRRLRDRGRRPARGTPQAHWKLTAEKVRAIRSDPRSCSKVAKDYGVSKAMIIGIRARKFWRNV